RCSSMSPAPTIGGTGRRIECAWSGWFGILRRTMGDVSEDRIPSVAGGITFFAFLAMFPAIAAIVSLYGMFADRASICDLIRAVSPFIPSGAVIVLDTELHHLIAAPPEKLNLTFVVGLAIAFWSASGGISALVEGLNVAYETSEKRRFLNLARDIALATA